MSKDLNLCQFIGRLGQDPEVRYGNNGAAIANMSVATSDDYQDKNSGKKVEKTNWIRVVAFGKLAEIIQQYVSKGSKIYVSGKMITRKWQDQSGQDRYSTEIVADQMQMLDNKSDGASGGAGAASSQSNQNVGGGHQAPQPANDFDDDIPF